MSDFNYKKLFVWNKSMELVKSIYQLTKCLPKSEEYGIKSQMRRAAISICSNIAEGSARNTNADQQRFYTIARSSLIELDSQIEIEIALQYFTVESLLQLSPPKLEVYKMLSKMMSPTKTS